MLVGEGSTQIKPNHSFEVQSVVEAVANGVVCATVLEGLADLVVVGSLQPNQPGVSQVCGLVWYVDVVVIVGAGASLGFVILDEEEEVVVISSLQPNQPGVLHVEVEVELVLVLVAVPEVVVSSRHPHQPGVLQVSVRVLVLVLVLVLLVVVSELLLSKNFQL